LKKFCIAVDITPKWRNVVSRAMKPATLETKMTFYIFRDRNGFTLSDGEQSVSFASEGQAIGEAVRMAQESNAPYSIVYHRP
jgi:hypothetical protein